MSLTRKLTLAFVFSILLSILTISLISNNMINNKFDSYLIEEQDKKFEIIRNDINELFLEKGNNMTSEDLSSYARMQGIYLEIRDPEDKMICCSNDSGFGRRRMMGNMRKSHHRMMNSPFRGNSENYTQRSFPLLKDNETIGSLIIGYYDDSHFTESALIFKDTLAKSFIISGIITILFGFLISLFMSKGLTNPLIDITQTANVMRSGNLKARSTVKTNTNEISQLSQSINYLAETLEKQEDLRKRYATDISHELRTPLTTLKSHVEGMIDGVWEPSHEHLNILLMEIDRLNKLVDDLKNTFKTLEGELSINKTVFSISDEMENIIFTFKPLFERENYLLESSIEANIEIYMDRDMLKQIMSNLLFNAIKYLDSHGKVSVTLTGEDNFIKIIVQDNGYGIEENDLPYIFERFYRSDVSRNKETGGTGLGLSIVKTLVEAHNGSVYVDSKLGKGTRFTVLLPTNS